jgi:hypothetical protein
MKRVSCVFLLAVALCWQAFPTAQAEDGQKEAVEAFLKTIEQAVRLVSEASQACWSPDGTKIAYTRNPGGGDSAGGISVLTLDGTGRTQRITADGKDSWWSPDGKWIAYLREGERGFGESVWLVSADGKGEPVFLDEGGSVYWMPDSKSVIYHSRRDRAVYKIGIAEGQRQREKVLDIRYMYPRPSPDGKEIAYVGPGGLCITSMDGSKPRSKSIEMRGFCGGWSPDGKKIAYGGFFGSGLGLCAIDASLEKEPEVLIPGNWSRPAWSPDGKFMVYDTMAEPLEVWAAKVEALKGRGLAGTLAAKEETGPAAKVAAKKLAVPEENLRIPEEMQACAENFRRIHGALQKYRKDKGELPNWLSDLVPDYLGADTLFCPNDSDHKSPYAPDPKIPCSYGYSFSPIPIPSYWDPSGRTLYREWKTGQVKLLGDVVPTVSCHHHGEKHLQLSVGGQIYWGPLIWERMFIPDYRFGDEQRAEKVAPVPAEAPKRKFEIPEKNRQIPEEMKPCAEKLRVISEAIKKYEKEKGKLPDWLSDLVPDYLSNETLFCPNDAEHKAPYSPDPKLACSYGYEFSSAQIPSGWDPSGRTLYRDWKPRQVKLFGDIVPLVRCHHHGERVINVSVGGQIYWGDLNWEWMFNPDYRFGDEQKVEEAPAAAPEAKVEAVPPAGVPKRKFEIPEENRQIPDEMKACAAKLRQIGEAVKKYEKDKGKLPDWLSDLVPDYLSKESLFCPDDTTYTTMTCVDPKLPCSYNYEFSLTPTGPGTFRDWKTEQMKLFGDVVPLVRCHHHGKHLNFSVGGALYWTELWWEHTFKSGYQPGDERALE